MPREPKSPEEVQLRLRIAAYLRREWERFLEENPDGTQRQFADLLKLHEGTVSKILRNAEAGAGLDVFLALMNRRVACESVVFRDPDKRHFQALGSDGRRRRHVLPDRPVTARKRGA